MLGQKKQVVINFTEPVTPGCDCESQVEGLVTPQNNSHNSHSGEIS